MSTKKSVILDFQVVSTGDPKYISILDFSQWGFIEDKIAIMEVIVAGASTPVTVEFEKGQMSVFNSQNLYMSCGTCAKSDLPDGIYTFTLKGSPDSFTKTRKFLKTDLIRLELDKYLIANDTNLLSATYTKYNEINFLLAVAEAHTRQDNLDSAQSFLQMAYDLVDNIGSC